MQKEQRGKMWRTAVTIIVSVLAIIMPFIVVFFVGICTPPQYADTYYGELHDMYARLKQAEGKKVVVVGNSNVAFGVDSALMEGLLKSGDLDYTVCNFGLYGSIGTKVMLDLSRDNIGEGDIVIFVPEISNQLLSLYFSAEEAWYALDSDMDMFWEFGNDVRGTLVGGFFGYAAKKYALWSGGTPAEPSGVYAHSSFDERCDLKNYERPYNTMPGGADVNNYIEFNSSQFGSGFIDYVNEYYADIRAAGAEMYYSFPPMNRDAVKDASEKTLDEFYGFVCDSFDFPVISDISDYIMDKEWFYDSNFHLNSSGMTVRTVQLVNDIKNQLGNTSKTDAIIPEKPVMPDPGIEGEGDNSCADCFTYEQDGNYYIITGLTDKGREQKELIVPYQVNGLYVKEFTAETFAGNTAVESITVQDNIGTMYDGSFDGCKNLKELVLLHSSPLDISVGYYLTRGCNCSIYVPEEALSAFVNNYFWGVYSDVLYGR